MYFMCFETKRFCLTIFHPKNSCVKIILFWRHIIVLRKNKNPHNAASSTVVLLCRHMHFLYAATVMVALLLYTNKVSMQVLEHVVFLCSICSLITAATVSTKLVVTKENTQRIPEWNITRRSFKMDNFKTVFEIFITGVWRYGLHNN